MFNHHLIEDQCSITVHSIFDHVFIHLIEEERNTCENKNIYIWKFVSAKRNIQSLMTFVIYVYNNTHNSDAMICYITFLFDPIYALSMFNHCSINGTFSWKDRHMFWTVKPTRTEMHARRRRALEHGGSRVERPNESTIRSGSFGSMSRPPAELTYKLCFLSVISLDFITIVVLFFKQILKLFPLFSRTDQGGVGGQRQKRRCARGERRQRAGENGLEKSLVLGFFFRRTNGESFELRIRL